MFSNADGLQKPVELFCLLSRPRSRSAWPAGQLLGLAWPALLCSLAALPGLLGALGPVLGAPEAVLEAS